MNNSELDKFIKMGVRLGTIGNFRTRRLLMSCERAKSAKGLVGKETYTVHGT